MRQEKQGGSRRGGGGRGAGRKWAGSCKGSSFQPPVGKLRKLPVAKIEASDWLQLEVSRCWAIDAGICFPKAFEKWVY